MTVYLGLSTDYNTNMKENVSTTRGTLYVLATPIGNLADITLRALEVLKSTPIIFAEDSRVTRKLLSHYDIKSHIYTLNQHSGDHVFDEVLLYLLNQKDVVYVSDAGTPGIADPVAALISHLTEHAPEISIVPIPGVSALTTAISVAALKSNSFFFIGFLPKKKRQTLFKTMQENKLPFVFFDSPYRILKNLEDIKTFFGSDTTVFIARELTKLHETLYRGTVEEVIGKLKAGTVKGEIVCVVTPKKTINME